MSADRRGGIEPRRDPAAAALPHVRQVAKFFTDLALILAVACSVILFLRAAIAFVGTSFGG